MKPAITAAQQMLDALKDVQVLTMSRVDIVIKALETMTNAEAEAHMLAVADEKNRYEAHRASLLALLDLEDREHGDRLAGLEARFSNRGQAYQKIREAAMRLRGELEDGNGDGAAIIAEAIAPPAANGEEANG